MAPGSPVDDAVRARILQAGRAEFPAVRLDDDALRELLGGRELPAELPDERAAELYVAFACGRADPAAIAAVKERYLPRVASAIGRGREPALVEEALQQLLATTFVARSDGRPPEIADFSGAGPLGAWLRIVALRIIVRLERKQQRLEGIGRSTYAVPSPENPELAYLRRKYSDALQAALEDAWGLLSDESRVLLRLRYHDGRSIDDIAAVENVHRATAARRVNKAEESLVQEARRLLGERLGTTDADVNSVLRLVRSQLQISVRRIFHDPAR